MLSITSGIMCFLRDVHRNWCMVCSQYRYLHIKRKAYSGTAAYHSWYHSGADGESIRSINHTSSMYCIVCIAINSFLNVQTKLGKHQPRDTASPKLEADEHLMISPAQSQKFNCYSSCCCAGNIVIDTATSTCF